MKKPDSYYAPKNFWRILIATWTTLTITLGFFSGWLFHAIFPDDNGSYPEGLIYAGIYAFVLILLFGLTWIPLNKRFPLHRKRNVFIHVFTQTTNSIIGFAIGNVVKGQIHDAFFSDKIVTYEDEISFILIAMICLIGILFINGFFYTFSYINRSKELEKGQAESELIALRAQINPHFLFNSLNSIVALIKSSPDEAEEVTQDLADLFRYTLRSSEKSLVFLSEELSIIDLYLNIEKSRFKDRLNIEYEIEKELHSAMVPSMFLQPLVENAIKHGVNKKEGEHKLGVHISRVEGMINVLITDSGPGFPHKNFDKILNQGTGLSNIFQRLQLQFGDTVDGSILDNGIQIRFPYQTEAKEKERSQKPILLNPSVRESYSG